MSLLSGKSEKSDTTEKGDRSWKFGFRLTSTAQIAHIGQSRQSRRKGQKPHYLANRPDGASPAKSWFTRPSSLKRTCRTEATWRANRKNQPKSPSSPDISDIFRNVRHMGSMSMKSSKIGLFATSRTCPIWSKSQTWEGMGGRGGYVRVWEGMSEWPPGKGTKWTYTPKGTHCRQIGNMPGFGTHRTETPKWCHVWYVVS